MTSLQDHGIPITRILDGMHRSPCISEISPATQHALASAGRVSVVLDRTHVYWQGDRPTTWYCVLDGAVCLCTSLRDGRQRSLRVLAPGAWFGDGELFTRQVRDHDAIAYGATTLLSIEASRFHELLLAHPELPHALLKLQSYRINLLHEREQDLAALSLTARVVKQLISLCESHGTVCDSGIALDIRLSQEEFAQLVGGSRPKVNRELKALERDGIIAMDSPVLVVRQVARLVERTT